MCEKTADRYDSVASLTGCGWPSKAHRVGGDFHSIIVSKLIDKKSVLVAKKYKLFEETLLKTQTVINGYQSFCEGCLRTASMQACSKRRNL